ncbi:hypothetical protein MKW94_002081 [Papaver nudicaule]|nr:hypothetical protein [Papaver nudicaule]
MRPGGANNGMQVMHNEATLGGGLNSGGPTASAGLGEFSRGTGVGGSSNPMDARGGNQQELDGGSKDAQGNSSNGEQ